MLLTWWRKLTRARSNLARHRRCLVPGQGSRRLRLEWLEDRLAPATHTWTGGATDSFWSSDKNWIGGSPFHDFSAVLIFPSGPANTNTNNDIEQAVIQSITFSGDNYLLEGKGIILREGISDSEAGGARPNSIDLDISLAAAQTIAVTNAPAVLNIRGTISGLLAAALTKDGEGTLGLSGKNSYAGDTILMLGILSVGNNSALGTGTLDLKGGGTLQASVASKLGNAVVVGDPPTIDGSNDLTFTGPVTLTAGNTLTITNTATTTFTGSLSGAGGLTVAASAGTVVLFAANTYTGTTTLTSGTLTLGNNSALGVGTLTANGGTIQANVAVTLANPFTVGGSVTVGGSNNLTFTGAGTVSGGATLTITNTGTTTFSGLAGTGSVSFSGGIANISGTYDLTGSTIGTRVIGGIVNFQSPVTSLGNSLTISAGLANFSGGAPISVPTVTLSGGVLSGGDTLTVSSQMFWTAGRMTGSGSTNIDPGNQGEARLDLSGDDPKYLQDSRTLNNRPGGHITWMGSGAIWVSGRITTTNGGRFDAEDGNRFRFNGVAGDTPLFSNTGTFNSSGTITFESGVRFTNNGVVQVPSGTLNVGDDYTQNGGVTSISSGAALTGGTVNISAGSLAVFGMVNGNVMNAGLLSGSGFVNGSVINAGQINPGDAGTTGILTIQGNYTQTGDGTLNIRIGGTDPGAGYDQLVITGVATLNGTLNVSLFNFTPQSGDAFQVLTFGSSSTTFATVNIDLTIFYPPCYDPNDVTLRAI